MAAVLITESNDPPLGDIRQLGEGDTVYTQEGWTVREDAGHYADAITSAMLRGANVAWVAKP